MLELEQQDSIDLEEFLALPTRGEPLYTFCDRPARLLAPVCSYAFANESIQRLEKKLFPDIADPSPAIKRIRTLARNLMQTESGDKLVRKIVLLYVTVHKFNWNVSFTRATSLMGLVELEVELYKLAVVCTSERSSNKLLFPLKLAEGELKLT